jgi:hypothetical protein
MFKITHYKKVIQIVFIFSIIIFLLEILLIKIYIIEPTNINKSVVTLLFLPPLTGIISILLLTYIRWSNIKSKGLFSKVLNGFIVFLTFCLAVLIVTLYIILIS